MKHRCLNPWKLVKRVFQAFDENIKQADKTIEAMSGVTLIKARAPQGQRVVAFRDESGVPRRRSVDAPPQTYKEAN